MTTQTHHDAGLTLNRILNTWWPLAISWLFMGLELPALSSIVARLPEPKINLAAYGGVVYPLALIIESPIIMLLAASTALSKDWDSYQKIRKFMMWTSAILTGMHILIAFTPVYYLVVEKLIGAPVEIVEPARSCYPGPGQLLTEGSIKECLSVLDILAWSALVLQSD
jgi:hypothetical protein